MPTTQPPKPPIPLDESEFLCGVDDCTNPYPCPTHQAFEAAACAPWFLQCVTGSSDDRLRGCPAPAECRDRGACAKPVHPLPYPMPMEQEKGPELYRGRDLNAPLIEIHRDITAPLPGRLEEREQERRRLQQSAAGWQRWDAMHKQGTPPPAEDQDEDDNTPTKPLPRMEAPQRRPPPEAMHGADITPPPPPPLCPKCGAAMVEGSEFSRNLCLNINCY